MPSARFLATRAGRVRAPTDDRMARTDLICQLGGHVRVLGAVDLVGHELEAAGGIVPSRPRAGCPKPSTRSGWPAFYTPGPCVFQSGHGVAADWDFEDPRLTGVTIFSAAEKEIRAPRPRPRFA